MRVNVDLGHWDHLSTSFEITNAEAVSFQQTLFKLSQLKMQHPKDAVDNRRLGPPDTKNLNQTKTFDPNGMLAATNFFALFNPYFFCLVPILS